MMVTHISTTFTLLQCVCVCVCGCTWNCEILQSTFATCLFRNGPFMECSVPAGWSTAEQQQLKLRQTYSKAQHVLRLPFNVWNSRRVFFLLIKRFKARETTFYKHTWSGREAPPLPSNQKDTRESIKFVHFHDKSSFRNRFMFSWNVLS